MNAPMKRKKKSPKQVEKENKRRKTNLKTKIIFKIEYLKHTLR